MSNINYNFNKLTPFKFFCLTNFPFIEEDFDSLNTYELLCKVVEYLNNVIDTTNTMGTQTEELTNAFNELKSYVDNYFTNLDVQTEINNKLDEMAQDGTLAKIINEDIFNELNQKVDNLIDSQFNLPNFFLHCYFDPNGSDQTGFNVHLFTSLNNKNVSRIYNNLQISGFNRDSKIYYNSNDSKFYIISTSGQGGIVAKILRTVDFVNFEEKYISISNISDDYPVWSPNLYFEDDKIYITFSWGDNSNNLMKNYYSLCNNITNLTFDNATEFTLINPKSTGYIDNQIFKYNNFYYLLLKNETSKIYELWRATSLASEYTIFNSNITNSNLAVEGGSICFDGKYFHFNAQCYTTDNQFYIYSKTNDLSKFGQLNIIRELYRYNNGNVIYIDNDNAKTILSKLPNFNFNNYDNDNFLQINNNHLVSLRENIDELVILPFTNYEIVGNNNITINKITNPFKVENVNFVFRTNYITLTINNIENPIDLSINNINRSYTNSFSNNEKIFTLELFNPFMDNFDRKIKNNNFLSNINSKFTVQSQDLTEKNGIVTIFINIKANENINEYLQIAKIPVDWAPPELVFFSSPQSNSIQLDNNGNISGALNINKNATIYASVSFVSK